MAMMMSMETYKDIPLTVEEAIEQVVLANRILSNEGVLDAFGHVSVRHPKNEATFLQSRSLSPELVTKNDILEINLEGTVVSQTDMKPYAERIIHAAIYKARPDVQAVFHGHPHPVIPFACTGVPIQPIVHFGAMFYEGMNIYDDYDVSSGMLIASREEGERVTRVLGNKRALLMRGHGCVVVGESIPRMVMGSIYLRDSAILQYQAMQIGYPKYLSYEEGRQANLVMAAALVVERAWGYWVKRAAKAMPDLLL